MTSTNAPEDGEPEGGRPRLDRLPGDWRDTARFQQDRRARHRATANRRRGKRLEVDAKATVGASLSERIEGHLTDLSELGCSFAAPAGAFGVGDTVWLRLDPIQPWRGIVRWVKDGRVGVEFIRPLTLAVFDHLAEASGLFGFERASSAEAGAAPATRN
jgi:hypothetical protein